MTPDTLRDLRDWLLGHEDDIKLGINDFGDLREVFFDVFGREAGESIEVAEPL